MLIAQGDFSLGSGIQGAGPLGDPDNFDSGIGSFFNVQFSNIIGFFTIIGGLFFIVQMLSAGFDWIMAGGEKGKLDSAKQKMINSSIGLLIMVLGLAIIGIIGGVFGIDILNPGTMFDNLTSGGK